MSVQAYQTAFSIWLDAKRNRFSDRLGDDTNLAKMARAEWMEMSEERKNIWREKANISAQCLRGRLRKPTRKGNTKNNPSESIDPSDAFSSLPPLILVRHILPRVLPAHYAQLHLVSRRFHRLLSYYADELPKQGFECLTFAYDWKDKFDVAEFSRRYYGSGEEECENLDGSRNDKGPSLAVLLRHQRLTKELKICYDFELRKILNTLILLAKHKHLCMTSIEFECCMSGVTEGQLKELLSHCSSDLKSFSVNRHADIGHDIITDAVVAAFVANGNLRVLDFSRPVRLTDLTLDRFPLIDNFYLYFKHERITYHGVYRFIQRFRNDQKNCSGQLSVCAFLEKPLLDLVTPDISRFETDPRSKFFEHETEWTIFKIPGDPSSPKLCLDFLC
uniref:F-box domain-containing protein n=1 Tax=Plectus sambesii TaxID=2011161 RepID=A0A914VNA1_9BILA